MPFQSLLNTMGAINDVHITLIELAAEKKQAIIDKRLDTLSRITKQESALLKRIGELEGQRNETIAKVLLSKGYRASLKVAISDLAKIIFNPEDKEMLLESGRRLMSSIHTLREANELNQQLIQHSLDYINFSVDLLKGPFEENEVIYHNPHQKSLGAARSGLFDTRG
ncbi:flagellar protein FlgN [Paenibacillus sp. y28]|uniref:flagellar protein FlgN n=1 Tax=Paenibacillus sp. y28 TaxID=3129110 RepID=UPI0030180E67